MAVYENESKCTNCLIKFLNEAFESEIRNTLFLNTKHFAIVLSWILSPPLTLHLRRLVCSPIQPHSQPVPLSQPLLSSMIITFHTANASKLAFHHQCHSAVTSDIINTITSKDPLLHYLNRYRIHFPTIKIIASAAFTTMVCTGRSLLLVDPPTSSLQSIFDTI